MMMRPTSGPPVPESLRRSMEYVVESLGAFQIEDENIEAVYERAAATFRYYDVDSYGTLTRSEMVAALAEMGAMHGLSPKVIDEVLIQDPAVSRDARYTLHDFLDMYGRLSLNRSKAGREERIRHQRHNSEPPPGSESNPALRQVFGAYCRYTVGVSRMFISESTPTMVAQQLHKLCVDINAIGDAGDHNRITTSSVDIAYTRCKMPGGRRLTFPQFLRVLCILGDESGLDLFSMMKEHASILGTHGLPAPVDPVTMKPLKVGNTELLPIISKDSKNQHIRVSSSMLPNRPNTVAAEAAPRHRTTTPSNYRGITPPAGHTFAGERPTTVPVARALMTNNFVFVEEVEGGEGTVQGKDAVTLAYEAALESAAEAAASAVAEAVSLGSLIAGEGQEEEFSDYSGRHWLALDRPWMSKGKKWEGVPLNYVIPPNPAMPQPILGLEEVLERILNLELFTGAVEEEEMGEQMQGGSPLQQLKPKVRLFERLQANEAAIEEVKLNAYEVPPKDTALGEFLAALDDGVAGAHEAVQVEAAQVHEQMKGMQEQLDKAAAALKEAEEKRVREVQAMRDAEERRWKEAEEAAAAAAAAMSALTAEAAARHEALLQRLAALEDTAKSGPGIDEAMLEERLKALSNAAEGSASDYAEREFMREKLEQALQKAEQAAADNAALQLRMKAMEEQAALVAAAAAATEAMAAETCAAAIARVEASELLVAELTGKLLAEQKQGSETVVSVQELRGQVEKLQSNTLSGMGRVGGSDDGLSMMEHKLEELRDQLRREIQAVQLSVEAAPEGGKSSGADLHVVDTLSNRVGELESQANHTAVKLIELALLEQQLRAQEAGIIAAAGAAAASGKAAGQASEQAASVVAMAGEAGEAAATALSRVMVVELKVTELNEKLLLEQKQGIETASALQELSGQLARLQGQVVTALGSSSGTTAAAVVTGSAKSGTEMVILGETTIASQGSQQLAASASEMQAQPSIPMFSRGSRPVTPSGYVNLEMFTGVTERLAELEGRVDYASKRLGVIGPLEIQLKAHDIRLVDTAEMSAAAAETISRMTEASEATSMKLEAMEHLFNELASAVQEVRASASSSIPSTPLNVKPQGVGTEVGPPHLSAEALAMDEEHGPVLQALSSRLAAVEAKAADASGSLNNLAQSCVELRIRVDRAEMHSESIERAAEEATSRLNTLADDVEVVKTVKQFSTITPKSASVGGGENGGNNVELVASVAEALESEIQQLAMALGELAGRTVSMERDLALTLTSYARVVDLKESENHLLDRQQQLHDEVEVVKDNMRTLREDMIQYSSSLAATMSLQQQTSTVASPLGTQPSKRVSMTVAGKVVKITQPALSAEMSTVATKTFATWDMVKQNEAVMMQKISALKTDLESLSQTAMDRVESHEQIIMRLAHQIDVLQSEVRQEQAAAGLGIADVEALLDQKAFVTLNDVDGLNQMVANIQVNMEESQSGVRSLRSDLQAMTDQDKREKQELRKTLEMMEKKTSGSHDRMQVTEAFEAKLTELVDVRLSTNQAGVKELITSVQTELTATIQTQIKTSQDSVLETLSAVDAKINKRVDLQEKVIMRIAQQVDVLQKAAPAAVKAAAKAAVPVMK